MRCLILDRPPGAGRAWLGEAPWALDAPAGGGFAVHLARGAPLSTLVAQGAGEVRLGPMLAAGWVEWPMAGPVRLHAEGAPVCLSLGEGGMAGKPALRVWEAAEAAPWPAARIWGRGAVVALGGGPARPVLRLAAGEAAWVSLPGMSALPSPRLVALRGPLPRAALGWGLPHAPCASGPGWVTLRLRAGLACEVVWAG